MTDYSDLFDTTEERTDTLRTTEQYRREDSTWTTAAGEAMTYGAYGLTPLSPIVERRVVVERLYRRTHKETGAVEEVWMREAQNAE